VAVLHPDPLYDAVHPRDKPRVARSRRGVVAGGAAVGSRVPLTPMLPGWLAPWGGATR
jgi:hypothetical protein